MKKFIVLIFVLVLATQNIFAQNSPYTFNFKKEAVALGSGTLLTLVQSGLHRSFNPLTYYQIYSLNPDEIMNFDRSAINHYSEQASQLSDISLIAALSFNALLPLAGLQKSKSASPMTHIFHAALLALETNLVTYGGTELAKVSTRRTRPYAYNPDVAIEEKLDIDARKSFFSGHTSFAAANSFLVASVFSDYYPDSKLKPWLWAAAAAYPAWTGLERYFAGKHFPTDILAGYAYGAFCGLMVPYLHKSRSNENDKLSIFPYPNGIALSYRL